MSLARRILLVLATVALVFVVMIAAFYALEDWRGARAWEACQRDLRAQGERLDVAAFIPPAIPDDQNLAMAPLFVRMYHYRVDPVTQVLTFSPPSENSELKDAVTAMPRGTYRPEVATPTATGDWAMGHSLDLSAWQQYYRRRPDFPHADQPQTPAEDVLLALTKYAPLLDELAQAAATRPLTRFPVNWTDPQPARIVLPHYIALQCTTGTLRLRATANLALGNTGAAMRDLLLARRLIGISAADPILIAQLVSVTQMGQMMQPIWEGLEARRWSGPELEQIKVGLRDLDYLAGYEQANRCERATFMCETADYLKAHGGAAYLMHTMQNIQGDGDEGNTTKFIGWLVDLMPGGWYDQNKATGCRCFQDDVIDTLDAKAHRVWLAKVRAGNAAMRRLTVTPYTWFVK